MDNLKDLGSSLKKRWVAYFWVTSDHFFNDPYFFDELFHKQTGFFTFTTLGGGEQDYCDDSTQVFVITSREEDKKNIKNFVTSFIVCATIQQNMWYTINVNLKVASNCMLYSRYQNETFSSSSFSVLFDKLFTGVGRIGNLLSNLLFCSSTKTLLLGHTLGRKKKHT